MSHLTDFDRVEIEINFTMSLFSFVCGCNQLGAEHFKRQTVMSGGFGQ